jgi:hypothetical protein
MASLGLSRLPVLVLVLMFVALRAAAIATKPRANLPAAVVMLA